MDVDKNLFLYDLAVVSIMKCEGPYVKEWLDYHLLAGVDHFFIYDNDSPDNQREVVKPYVDAGLVTYIFYPGQARQYEAYNAAVRDYRYFCRYMAFIDGDEFIFPQSDRSIVEVVDEIFEKHPKAAALGANIFTYGSNYQDKADYTKGVLERFTRRASVDDTPIFEVNGLHGGTAHISTIANPRRIDFFGNPHYAIYIVRNFAINENGDKIPFFSNYPPTVKKIVMNHYSVKSREEYEGKIRRGTADAVYNIYKAEKFLHEKDNEIFDDSILKYRKRRQAELVPKGDILQKFAKLKLIKINKLLAALSSTLLPGFVVDDAQSFFSDYQKGYEYFSSLTKFFNETQIDFFQNKTETYLTCLALSGLLKGTFLDDEFKKLFEEFSLYFVYKTFRTENLEVADIHMLINELPKILALPYPAVEKIRKFCFAMIPPFMDIFREYNPVSWKSFAHFQYILDMLKVFDNYNIRK